MTKRKLDLGELQIESFATQRVSGESGTVRAHGQSEPYHCYSGVWTCLDTCEDTCGLSCWGSCVPTCDCA